MSEIAPRGVSVVIPTIHRAEVLLDTIRDLLVQDFDDWELIIVDQSDEVNCEALALLQDSEVLARYFKAQFRGLPQARNFGWRQAQKDIVLYIDDDIRCGPRFIQDHWDAHNRPNVGLVAGGIDESGMPVTTEQTGSFNRWTATPVANFGAAREGFCTHVKGCNFSVKRELLTQHGGFDEHLTVGAALYEELEFALRVSHGAGLAWFAPNARLVHLAAPAGGCRVPNNWPRYMRGMAHNRAILIFRHLRWWHRPTALLRLLMFGLSYSRLDGSLRPLLAAFNGLVAGRRAAGLPPLNADLLATECTSC